MAQIFHPAANAVSRIGLLGALFAAGGAGWILAGINNSSYVTRVTVIRSQPVPFSHKHHVSGLGIDCRYCHTTVETSGFAGMPATETCMSCHSQIWASSPMLEPVRESYRTGRSIEWTRVHDLPDFVYFNHSIHVNKGVGCETCHGRVDLMPLMWKTQTLQMQWCLECHNAPERFLRPRALIFTMGYTPPEDQRVQGRKLMAEYKVRKLTDCYTCHR